MTARTSGYVVLIFAAVWLWIGASALPMPWNAVAGAIGGVTLLAIAWHVLRRPASAGSTRRFDRRKFWIAVAFEVVAANVVALRLGQLGLIGYLWPAFGIIVALHFIGLWWASHDLRFIALTLAMLAVNVVALFFEPGGAAMLALSGLGSSAALAAAMVRPR
jgi:hypothetical protein